MQQEETKIHEVQESQEPGSLLEVAQMVQTYMNYMIAKAEEIQEEDLNLYKEIGHMQLALEAKQIETQQAEAKLTEETTKCITLNQTLDIEKGKVMGYQVQLTELQYKIDRMQKDHLNEVDRITWEKDAELKAKNLQLEAL